VINLDANTLEIYKGFWTAPNLVGNRYGIAAPNGDYYACELIKEIHFGDLTEEWIDELKIALEDTKCANIRTNPNRNEE